MQDLTNSSTTVGLVGIVTDLVSLNAPKRIIEVAEEVQKYLDASLRPPASLVEVIEGWVYRPQNRYGR